MNRSTGLSRSFRHLFSLLMAVQMVTLFSYVPFAQAKEVSAYAGPTAMVSGFSEQGFLKLTNDARIQNGLPPLTLNDELIAAASAKANDMVQKGYWDHFRPGDNKAPWAFISESGYDYKVAGENLARGFKTSDGITKAWLASPTHRANIMSKKYTEVGFATVRSTGTDGQTVLLTVQMFGSR